MHQILAELCPFESFCKLFAAYCLEIIHLITWHGRIMPRLAELLFYLLLLLLFFVGNRADSEMVGWVG